MESVELTPIGCPCCCTTPRVYRKEHEKLVDIEIECPVCGMNVKRSGNIENEPEIVDETIHAWERRDNPFGINVHDLITKARQGDYLVNLFTIAQKETLIYLKGANGTELSVNHNPQEAHAKIIKEIRGMNLRTRIWSFLAFANLGVIIYLLLKFLH